MSRSNTHLPDFCFDPNRSFTFSNSNELIEAASTWWPKKKIVYIRKPILKKVPSLAIEPPKILATPPPEPKVEKKPQSFSPPPV